MNNSEIFLLSLINQSPRYGYEIAQFLEESNASLWLNISMPYVYRLLKHFSDEGWVASQVVESENNRPNKNVYEITEQGREVLFTALTTGQFTLDRIFFGMDVVLAVYTITGKNFLLDDLIQAQIHKNEAELKRFNLNTIQKGELSSDAAIAMLIIEHRIEFLKAELEWLKKVKTTIVAGRKE
jgi:DNA-binding PadR family transcriptional regulator